MNAPTNLPSSSHLPVEHLAASFGDVTNSYKFYWLLAILENLKAEPTLTMPFSRLIASMIGNVWYPVNYFLLSFGKQDRLGNIALDVRNDQNLMANTPRTEVVQTVLRYWHSPRSGVEKKIRSLGIYVPYRFLRPFFAAELRGLPDWKVNAQIRILADQSFQDSDRPCLYRFVESPEPAIELHPRWADYLRTNLHIVTGYCLWHLTNYLQKNNPNVPNIVGKLAEPGQRNLRNARTFWQVAMNEIGECRCIYTGEVVEPYGFSLDHFLPWSFVAHDLLWNIIPTSPNVNSAKSDQLPALDRYFDSFAQLQYQALHAVAGHGKAKLLEDYILLLRQPSVDELTALSLPAFAQLLQDTITPQVQIARNMGFAANWSYRPS
jgi:hypothetical protein